MSTPEKPKKSFYQDQIQQNPALLDYMDQSSGFSFNNIISTGASGIWNFINLIYLKFFGDNTDYELAKIELGFPRDEPILPAYMREPWERLERQQQQKREQTGDPNAKLEPDDPKDREALDDAVQTIITNVAPTNLTNKFLSQNDKHPLIKQAVDAANDYNLAHPDNPVPHMIVVNLISVESGWNPSAKNGKSSATGLGQLTKAAALEMGLSVKDPDERLDPEKNLAATVGYLGKLQAQFGNTTNAILSYYMGQGVVNDLADIMGKTPKDISGQEALRFLSDLDARHDELRAAAKGKPDDSPAAQKLATFEKRKERFQEGYNYYNKVYGPENRSSNMKPWTDFAKAHGIKLTPEPKSQPEGNGTLVLRLPIEDKITSPWGRRTHPVTGEQGKMHRGIDIRAQTPVPLHVSSQAQVVSVSSESRTPKFGNTVVLSHGYGVYTQYAHLSQINVKPGDTLDASSPEFARTGSTGRGTGPHLDYSVIIVRDGVAYNVDPEKAMGMDLSQEANRKTLIDDAIARVGPKAARAYNNAPRIQNSAYRHDKDASIYASRTEETRSTFAQAGAETTGAPTAPPVTDRDPTADRSVEVAPT